MKDYHARLTFPEGKVNHQILHDAELEFEIMFELKTDTDGNAENGVLELIAMAQNTLHWRKVKYWLIGQGVGVEWAEELLNS